MQITIFPKPGGWPHAPVAEILRRGGVGLALSCLIAFSGLRKRSLARSGAAGGIIMGSVTTTFGGYGRAALLVAFFLSSSGLSRLPSSTRHNTIEHVMAARSEQRDVVQVIANGGIPMLIAVVGGTDHNWLIPYLGSLAAVTGDTWATEIGSRSASRPRHLLTGAPVPPGTSGGVTLPGTAASIAGGAFIGSAAAIAGLGRRPDRSPTRPLVIAGTSAGAIGSLVDSLLGATIQERRWCDTCQLPTEQPVHRCGTTTRIIGGVPGLNNDVVNAACSLTGALVGYVVQHTLNR